MPIVSDDRRYSQNRFFDGHMVGQLREGDTDSDTKTLMTNKERTRIYFFIIMIEVMGLIQKRH